MPIDPNSTNADNVAQSILDKVGTYAQNNTTPDPTGQTGPNGPVGTDPNQPSEYVEDPFDFNTAPSDITGVPDFGGHVNLDEAGNALIPGTQRTDGQHTVVNPDGSVSIAGGPETREVQGEELVSEQLSGLLNSDSKYMQDARRQGLEQSAAMGGLGGTAAAGAAMQAAIRAGLPIAQANAQAYQAAATENLAALNQYAQLNLNRATELEMGNLSAQTSIRNTAMSNNASIAMKKLESATQRDISMLDADTKLRSQEMAGQIQARMESFQYQYNSLLNDQKAFNDLLQTQMQGEYGLADTELRGQWEAAMKERQDKLQRESTANQLYSLTYDGYMNRLADLNGSDMDNNAKNAAIQAITDGAKAMFTMIQGLYPDLNLPDML